KRSPRQRLHPRHQRPSPRPIVDRKSTPAYVLLEDGAWFPGTAPLPFEQAYAEVVFTTNLSGYQEVFTDPSYLGQIVVMTAPMNGLDLASAATIPSAYTDGPTDAAHHVVAFDFGMKRNILRLFVKHGCRVTVVPAATTAAAVRGLNPDGVFLSNGPGDPAAVGYAIATIRDLSDGTLPIFGICLGHQLMGLALGGETVKLPYGHRGGNHPVRDLATGQVLITSQNHGFAVRGETSGVPGAKSLEVTHLNLNDRTVEGIRHREYPIFAVQYHPEASPGPHDAQGHFQQFLQALDTK